MLDGLTESAAFWVFDFDLKCIRVCVLANLCPVQTGGWPQGARGQ